MMLPDDLRVCARSRCDNRLTPKRRRYCSNVCREADRRERNWQRNRQRQRGNLIAEIALVLVSITLNVINGFATAFPTKISLWVFTGIAVLASINLEYKHRSGHFFPRSRRRLFTICV